VRWFRSGLDSGDVNQCNTFETARPWNNESAVQPISVPAVERGRGYCNRACRDAGRAANVSVAMTAMWNDPAARARM